MIFANGKSLTARQLGERKYKVDVHRDLDDDVGTMLETLKQRVKKALSITFMNPDGYISDKKSSWLHRV